MFRDRVVAALAQGLATQDAPAAEHAAAQGPETGYGNAGIIGTGWMEAAAGPEEGTQPLFVQGQQE